MDIRHLLLSSLVLCSSSLALAQEHHWVFTYEEGGGLPGSTELFVKVSDDGTFRASAEGLLIERALTTHDFSAHLATGEIAQFVELARAASDFVLNPEKPWPDCKWAEM